MAVIHSEQVILDLRKGHEVTDHIHLRRGEKGLTSIDATVLDGSTPYNLTGCSVLFKALDVNNRYVIGSTKVTNATAGKVSYTVDSKLTSIAGNVALAYFEITNSNNTITTPHIPIIVLDNVDLSGTQADEYESEISQLLKALEDGITSAQTAANDAAEAVRNANSAVQNANSAITNANNAVKNANDAIKNAEAATSAANKAATDATTKANQAAQTATNTANQAAENATRIANEAAAESTRKTNEAIENAAQKTNEAVDNANQAAQVADEAAQRATNAAVGVEEAIADTKEATNYANEAAKSANEAANRVDESISNAETATKRANDAADRVDESIQNAYDAAGDATIAAGAAKNATEEAREAAKEVTKALDEFDTIIGSEIRYAPGDSPVDPPEQGWTLIPQKVDQGLYQWTRTITYYKQKEPTTSYSIAHQGIDGRDGLGVETSGLFWLWMKDNGDLYASYSDDTNPPGFRYDEETGNVYAII